MALSTIPGAIPKKIGGQTQDFLTFVLDIGLIPIIE